MVPFTAETMFGCNFIPVKEIIHINKTGVHIHVGTDAFHEFCDTGFGALILVGKERCFWQDCSTFQKIILTKLFKQPLKRLFNPFLLFFVQRQFRSAPKHIRSLSITVDLFNSRNSRHVSFHLNSAQALAASGALRSAFTPLQFTHISTRGKSSTLSSIRPVKRPEGRAPFPPGQFMRSTRHSVAGFTSQNEIRPDGTVEIPAFVRRPSRNTKSFSRNCSSHFVAG